MSASLDISQLVGLNANKPVLDKAGFAAVIASCLTSLSPAAVVWKNDPQPFIGDQNRARVVLDLFSMTGLAWDERRRVYNLPGYPPNSFVTVLLGNRTLIITIRAEAFDASVEAAEIIDQIRSKLYSDASNDALNAINIAYVDSIAAVRVSYQVDERVVNAAIADFTFAGVAQHVSGIAVDGNVPGPGTGPTWIQTVDGNNIVPGDLEP
jgi:hypothetical protein